MSSIFGNNPGILDDHDSLPKDKEEFFNTLVRWVDDWQELTSASRDLMKRDVQYTHHKQWTDDEITLLEERGQAATVSNLIADKVNFALGLEDDLRSDVRCYERTPLHGVDASIAEDAINYEDDRLSLDTTLLRALKDLYTAGVGAVVFNHAKGARGNFTVEHVPWDRLIWDPRSCKEDFSDAHYMGVMTWRRWRDVLHDPLFAKRKQILRETQNNPISTVDALVDDKPQAVWSSNGRLLIAELYYKERDNKSGKWKWYLTYFTGAGVLVDPIEVPYLDDPEVEAVQTNWCPIVAASAYVDEDNNRYSPVRGWISLQDEINKRRSKFLHLLSVRQAAIEESAILDEAELMEQLARPDGLVRVQHNALNENRFQILPTGDIADGQFTLYQDTVAQLNSRGAQAALVNAEIRDISARSFLAQQEAGSKELGLVRANVREFKLAIYTRIWWMIRQYRQRSYWLRIRDELEGSTRFVHMNREMTKRDHALHLVRDEGIGHDAAIALVFGPVGVQVYDAALQDLAQKIAEENQKAAQRLQRGQSSLPPTPPPPGILEAAAFDHVVNSVEGKEPFKQNSVAALNVDIRLDLIPESAVVEHEQYQQLVELARHGVPIPPMVLIQASRLRNKREILTAMQPDPTIAQRQQQQFEAQIAKLQAEVASLQARAQKDSTLAQVAAADAEQKASMAPLEAQELQAKVEKTQAEADTITERGDKEAALAMKHSTEAGLLASGMPITRPAERAKREGGE